MTPPSGQDREAEGGEPANLVTLSIEPITRSDQDTPEGVRLVSQARFGSNPGPLIGFAPGDRLNGDGFPYISRRVTVVWGWHFPTCVLPRLGASPVGDPELDRARLGDDPITLSKVSRRRLEASAGPVALAVERCGRLRVCIDDVHGRPVLREGITKAQIVTSAPPAVLSLAVGLWAADQQRAVWSIGRHLVNGI